MRRAVKKLRTMLNSVSRPVGLTNPPRQFFMGCRDLSFWLRSARADQRLAQLQREHSTQKAFDLLYERTPDPWGYLVPHYRYQRLKYEKMLAMLPARPYGGALDVGCGLGVFTRRLAPYVHQAVGAELSGVAVGQARVLSAGCPNLRFEQAGVEEIGICGAERVDLLILADVLYYLCPLSDEKLKSIVAAVERRLQPGGILLLANHFFFGMDAQSRQVRHIHDAFRWAGSLRLLQERWHPFFLVATLQKTL